MEGRLLALCTGPSAPLVTVSGEGVVSSAIVKRPVERRVRIAGIHVDGDEQADTENHGGPDKAVYAYAAEDTRWWEGELDRPLPPGMFGENLHTEGVDWTGAGIGDVFAVGGAVLQVAQPRMPCFKLAARMGDARFVRRFAAAGRPGAYLRILDPGEAGAGDPVHRLQAVEHGVTVHLVSRAILGERDLLPRLLEAPQLPLALRAWAERRLQRPG